MSEFELQIGAAILMLLIIAVPVSISNFVAKKLGKIRRSIMFLLVPSIAAVLPIILLSLNQGGDPYGAIAIIGVAIFAFVIGLVLSGVTYSLSVRK
jgi:hypothetical protein